MASRSFNKGIKRTALSLALGMCFTSPVILAQSAVGSVFGTATPGASVVIENPDTGFHREISADGSGRFTVSQLAPGTYTVTAGGITRTVIVRVGTGTNVSLDASTLATIEVIGSGLVNPIDVSSVESTTIMTEARIDAIAVPRSITSVALLAPGTVRGDNRFGNLASFGGASVAENVYYVNGFNVTNIVTGLAFSQVPFEAISEQQVKTGGYGAEFGRSLGGVINLVTKRGTNDWKFGGNVFWRPESLNTIGRFAYDPERDGSFTVEESGEVSSLRYNAYAGGPIVQDRLFMFALLQGTKDEQNTRYEGGGDVYETSTPQGLLKIDWNLGDNHVVELTAFRDKSETDGRVYQRPAGDQGIGASGSLTGTSFMERGGDNYIGRWTGYLTDSFTLSALYGVGKYSRGSSDSNSADCPIIRDFRLDAVVLPRARGCNVLNFIGDPGAGDKRTAWRVDGEWAIGDHTVKFGMDNEEFDTQDGSVYSGFGYWAYFNATSGTTLPGNGGVVPAGVSEVVRFRLFQNGGNFLTKNSAWYVEDTWQINDNFMVYGGVRNEAFENLNSLGGSFIDVTDTWAPRLGFSWNVKGDSSLKVFGNAGRYYIPVYANTNVRLAGSELDYNEWYTFSSIDPATGAPGGLNQLGTRFVTSDGDVPDPLTVVDNNLSPMYQDEYILGAQMQFNENWTGGVRAVYRDLKSGMDDICNYDEPYAWALANGYTESQADAIGSAVNHCFLTNPGLNLSANVDLDGTGELTVVEIPGAALGLPEATRKYQAIEFFFEGNWDNFFLQGSYTWAKSRGNTEGYVKSDNGQDDAGITQDFDYPGLMDGAYGYLPNDRRHSIKLFGNYRFNDEWSIGGNVLAQSGRPINCFGVYPADGPDSGAPNYGVASFYCGTDIDDAYPDTLHPRGTSGRLPWVYLLDAQVVYTPNWADGLKFRMVVNNVFDSKDYYRVDDSFEGSSRAPSNTYGHPRGFVSPRGVTFNVEYDF